MALSRTGTSVKLQADDGLYYDVLMVDKGSGAIIAEPDDSTGAAGASDTYVAVTGSDSQVYRWSLLWVDDVLTNQLTLSPDQGESSLPGVDLLLGGTWYRATITLFPDTTGDMTPALTTEDGTPWSDSPISGTTSWAFAATGNLKGLLSMSGVATMSWGSQGSLKGSARLSGSASFQFDASGTLSASGDTGQLGPSLLNIDVVIQSVIYDLVVPAVEYDMEGDAQDYDPFFTETEYDVDSTPILYDLSITKK